MKKCNKCGIMKPYKEYHKYNASKDGYKNSCKVCRNNYNITYKRSKRGLILRMYETQLNNCKKRNHALPSYTRKEFIKWIFDNPNFELLYKNWIDSEFKKELRPSIDRLNDYKSYSFGNIRLVTWKENLYKAAYDRKNYINRKNMKPLMQFDKEGNYIKEFYSSKHASRELNVSATWITHVCKHPEKKYKVKGFIFKYKL